MPSPTDFNLSPYYDDFTESKKFHRVLFRPGFAVQARELTQSQTILQNQMERSGDHFFKKGAMVIPGEIAFDVNYYAVKLSSIESGVSLSSFNGIVLTGGTSGVTATVVNTVVTDGTDPDTLYVKYTNSGTSNTATSFSDGETLTGTATLSGTPTSISCVVDTTATGSAASIVAGVYYINGFYVSVDDQTIILDKYTNTPSYRIGVTITESYVTPNDDSSLEDNLARRTFDESGDYSVREYDLDIREHLISGTNRGIYTALNGGDATKLAAGIGPGKSYVKGYELENIGTTYVDIDKAREFNTENNFNTRFDLGNYVNVTNVYNSPDIGFVSGDVEAFKAVNLYKTATSSRGTEQSTSGVNVPQIGRAKSRGFEYVTGTASGNTFASGSLTSAIYKHYLFDINMFTHINITTNQTFTTGEVITGSTSGATATVQSLSATESQTINSCTSASPGVATISGGHDFVEGQQVTFAGTFQVDSVAVSTAVYTVRNPSSTTFELYESDGTTPVNITSFTSATATHGVVVVSNVQGTFSTGETITGGTSSNTAVIQSNAVGFDAVRSYDFPSVKQIGMAGGTLIPYTADTATDVTYGESFQLFGSISVANSGTTVTGFGTLFNTELKIGDSITFTTDAGTSITRIVESISSDTSLELSTAVGGGDVSTKTIATRNRGKLQDSNKNISIFQLPNTRVKTLKTESNSGLTDTNFEVRRQFTGDLSSDGDISITAGTNETFSALAELDFTVSITSLGAGPSGAVGDVLSLSGNNHEGSAIFTPSGSPLGKTLTLDFGANYASHTVKILATVNRSIANSKSKTLNSN